MTAADLDAQVLEATQQRTRSLVEDVEMLLLPYVLEDDHRRTLAGIVADHLAGEVEMRYLEGLRDGAADPQHRDLVRYASAASVLELLTEELRNKVDGIDAQEDYKAGGYVEGLLDGLRLAVDAAQLERGVALRGVDSIPQLLAASIAVITDEAGR